MEFSISIQGDSEGYVVFECPFCGSEFKLKAGEFQDEDNPLEDLYCPYCGLTRNRSAFYSKEVIEHAKAVAYNYMVNELNSTFGKMAKSMNKSKSMVKMNFRPLKQVAISELKEKDTTETAFICGGCERSVKVLYCAGVSKVFCPYCGVDI